MRRLALACLCLATPAFGHEYWLAPTDYQVAADGMLVADIVNGQGFEGNRMPYLPSRVASYEARVGTGVAAVEMRPGDRPGLNVPALGDGLTIVTQVTTPAKLDYDGWDVFLQFVAHKDLLGGAEDVAAQHEARGFSQDEVSEAYTRFCKTLIAVGSGTGADMRVGLETEFVAQKNPYTDDLSGGMPVVLYYGDEVRADAQIEVFDRAPDGEVVVGTLRTDATGTALIPVAPGHEYMLDAVILREPSAGLVAATGAMWESLWANLTFDVPA